MSITTHPDSPQPIPEPPEQAREPTQVPREPHFIKKVGNTTYHVNLHFSKTSTETLEDKIERLVMREVEEILKNDE